MVGIMDIIYPNLINESEVNFNGKASSSRHFVFVGSWDIFHPIGQYVPYGFVLPSVSWIKCKLESTIKS